MSVRRGMADAHGCACSVQACMLAHWLAMRLLQLLLESHVLLASVQGLQLSLQQFTVCTLVAASALRLLSRPAPTFGSFATHAGPSAHGFCRTYGTHICTHGCPWGCAWALIHVGAVTFWRCLPYQYDANSDQKAIVGPHRPWSCRRQC
jgi:hypothetical protein